MKRPVVVSDGRTWGENPAAYKPRHRSAESNLRRLLTAILVLFVCLSVGIGMFRLVVFPGWLADWLESAFVVGITCVITFGVMMCYPHVFDFRTFRLPGVLVVGYVGMVLLPLPWVYADFPQLERGDFLLVATGSFLATLGGIVVAYHLFPTSAARVRQWITAPTRSTQVMRALTVGLLLGCIVLLTIYVQYVGRLPVVDAILGGKTRLQLDLARENAFKLLPKALSLSTSYLRNMLFPYATLMLLVVAIRSRNWIWRGIFAVSLLGNLLLASATLEKSPVAAFLGMLALTWLMARGRVLSTRAMIPIGIAAFAFPVFVVMASYGFRIGPERLFDALFRRLFYGPSEVILAYVDYFPRYSDFLWGRTLPYINKLLPGGPIWIENIIALRYFYEGIESGNANSGYPGYLWADFGWLGVVFGGLVVGLILQSVQTLIVRMPKSAPSIALQALLVWQTFILNSGSFGGWLDWAMWEIGFALILLFLLAPRKAFKPATPSGSRVSCVQDAMLEGKPE